MEASALVDHDIHEELSGQVLKPTVYPRPRRVRRYTVVRCCCSCCCQVSVEERLAQSEKRVATEAQKQFDLELAELRERIEAVQKV